MYSNLTLYYLNQMGITPWVNKEYLSNLEQQSNTKNAYQLVVLTSTAPNDKVHSLFHQMLNYINLQHDDVFIISVSENESGGNVGKWSEQLLNKASQALLSFGPNINDLNVPYPKFQSVSLEYLLNNPSSKKEVFQVLTRLKARLQPSS